MTACLPVAVAAQKLVIDKPERLSEAISEQISTGTDTWVAIDGGLAVPVTSVGPLPAGPHELLLVERGSDGEIIDTRWLRVDVAENAGGTPFVFEPGWTVDRTPPRLISSDKPVVIGRNGNVPVSAVDPLGVASVHYLIDGKPWEETSLDASRDVRLELAYSDGAGNSSREVMQAILDVDAPLLSLLIDGVAAAGSTLTVNEDTQFSAQASDGTSGVSGIYWRSDDARWRPAGEVWTLFDTESTRLEVKAVDLGGNETSQEWGLSWE